MTFSQYAAIKVPLNYEHNNTFLFLIFFVKLIDSVFKTQTLSTFENQFNNLKAYLKYLTGG